MIHPGLSRGFILGAFYDRDSTDLKRRALQREGQLYRQAFLLLHLDIVCERDPHGKFSCRGQFAWGAPGRGVLGHVLVKLRVPLKGFIFAHQLYEPTQHRV